MITILDRAGIPVHCVSGNIAEKFEMTRNADSSENIKLYGDLAEFEIDNKKVAVTHFPHFANALASTKKYDVVFCGHTHNGGIERIKVVLVVNPGTLAGI